VQNTSEVASPGTNHDCGFETTFKQVPVTGHHLTWPHVHYSQAIPDIWMFKNISLVAGIQIWLGKRYNLSIQ
jgi:hypothetical protein